MAFNLIVSPLINLVVGKAANSVIGRISEMYHLKDNYDKLHRQLLAIRAKIADAEERSRKESLVKVWLKDLRAIANEADDVLDDFQYEALRRRALDEDCSSFDPVRNVVHPNYNLFGLEMSKKLVNVLEKIDEIVTEMEKFSFLPSVDHQPQFTRPPTSSCVIESDIIGRDSEKEAIVNILTDPNRNKENISILSIVGMGGAGKTTLAQLVYNEKNVKECFQERIWVCVSNDFHVVNIVKSIIDVATNGGCVFTSNLEVLQKRLHEILAKKKFLLVLDDIWNEEVKKWDDLKTLLFSIACTGSVIIVTTRSKNVASIMGTLPLYDLTMLSKENSWKLFQNRAFGDGEVSQQLVEIGKTIVDKCAGLPLALNVIGALLGTKQQLHEWHAILENIIWDDETEILPVLKLSYDQLAPYTKQCFAYCAMFPQDYEIPIETLIRLWMANGFIPDYGTMDLEEKGWCIFYELYSRCFFQDIREYMIHGRKIICCKMHDLMHNLAKDIVGKQCASMLDNRGEEVLHLTIFGNQFLKIKESDPKKFTALRTCRFSPNFAKESENGNLSDPMKSTSFRALKINRIDQLPMELGYIKHLRYLDLSFATFDFLPETICKLYNLQTLNLYHSNIYKLPERLRCLISLRHLLFCTNLKKLPVGIGRLRDLRTLTEYMVDRDLGLSIRELKDLNNLHGELVISGLENVRDRNEAEEANLVSKTKISSLVLKWGFRNNEEVVRTDQEVLEGLKPYKELNYLYITCYEGFDFPIWMKEMYVLRNMTELILDDCINCRALPLLWKLPLLKKLKLVRMRRLLYICSTGTNEAEENEHPTFPNLKKLVMLHLYNLEGWHEKNHNSVAFPKLKELQIRYCPRLRGVPYTPSLRLFETNSIGIRLLDISNMDMATSSKLIITLPETAIELDAFRPPKNVKIMELSGFENVIPLEEDDKEKCLEMSLRQLHISDCNCFFSRGPSKLVLEFWRHFASLESLEIYICNALSFWPKQEFRSLKCLKFLKISNCKNFTCSSQASSSRKKYGEDFLPRLETLVISYCPKLVEIPKICSKSLKVLDLWDCPSLSKEGLNWLKNLHELKELQVSFCNGLKSLPDGLEGLTSFQRLVIYKCPEIESFPEGLQQRLSQLQYLEIRGCLALAERCKSRGDYQHLVSPIPWKVLDANELLYETRMSPTTALSTSISRNLEMPCIGGAM